MNNRWLLHALFWLVYWFVFTFSNGNVSEQWGKYAHYEAAQMPARMLATYLAFWCLDNLRPSWKAFAGVIGAVLLGGIIVRFIKMVYLGPVLFPDKPFYFFNHHFITDCFDSALAAGAALTARLYFRQLKFIQRESQLRSEKSEAELRALKNQLNPHFLFNTINNLYALARVKSDKTAPVALQLANLLRYLLYDSSARTVSLAQEVKLLQQYVELEQLRFDEDRLSVHFEVGMDNPDHQVPPLLMLPLVENAFKHGASESLDEAWVNIRIQLKDRHLQVHVSNSKAKEEESPQKGIGLQNLRRQLELLYPQTGTLEVTENQDTYTALLSIKQI